jgi:serine/threonine-protein kinase
LTAREPAGTILEGSVGIEYEQFGPYAVYEHLGTGGMATVHRAIYDDGEFVREVALKRLLPQHADDKTFVDDFVREGKLAAQLAHPSIVKIHDRGRIDRTHFIAMELVVGVPVMQLIRAAHHRKHATPIGVVLALMSELCDALDYACNGTDRETGERFNFVHRDLSPSNLLVTDDGHLKVIDFGVAKAIAGRFATATGLVKGKLGYMSVEALAGKNVDGRSDVFSVGVVAWELITGKRLFTGKTELDVIQRVRDGAVVPPSTFNASCTPTLDAIVLQALARARDDRWSTAGALRQALETTRRAYREESTPAAVVAWREALIPPVQAGDAGAATAPIPRFERFDSESEMTQHRASPVRPHTMIDLFEEDPQVIADVHAADGHALADGTDEVRADVRPDTPLTEPVLLFDTFPADEPGVRTVLASPAYPANAFHNAPTVAFVEPVSDYAELSVKRSDTTAGAAPPVSTVATQTTPIVAPVETPSGTSITALTLAPPPANTTLEMLQFDDAVDDALLDLEDPAMPDLLDLDDPPEPPEPPAPSDTIVVKR